MRDDDPLWWTPGSWNETGRIRMCYAANIWEAMVMLGEPNTARVNQCSTPYLVQACSEMPGGVVWEMQVESKPSIYDQFTRPGFRGWDFQAMIDAGFDIE